MSALPSSDPIPALPALDEPEVVAALSALAHPVRLRIFRALVVVGPSGLTPGAMVPARIALRSDATTASGRTAPAP